MPRFYFDVEIEEHFVRDTTGLELPDAEAAMSEARSRARRKLNVERGGTRYDIRSEVSHVRDDRGKCVVRLPYAAFLR